MCDPGWPEVGGAPGPGPRAGGGACKPQAGRWPPGLFLRRKFRLEARSSHVATSSPTSWLKEDEPVPVLSEGQFRGISTTTKTLSVSLASDSFSVFHF